MRMPDSPVKTLGRAARKAKYGEFNWRNRGGGAITILGDWADRNIRWVFVPQLRGLPTYPQGAKFSGKVGIHRSLVAQLHGAFEDIEEAGLLDRVIFWGGSFVPRHICWDNARSLSPHSFGIAMDINVAWNRYGATPAAAGQTGSVRDLVPILDAWGFGWGGFWKHPDGMHFEAPVNWLSKPRYDWRPFVGDTTERVVDWLGIEVPYRLLDGRAHVPVRELAEGLGLEVAPTTPTWPRIRIVEPETD